MTFPLWEAVPAFIYSAVGVTVAAGLLYPLVGLLISPLWASAAMTFSSLSVIGNAQRLPRLETVARGHRREVAGQSNRDGSDA